MMTKHASEPEVVELCSHANGIVECDATFIGCGWGEFYSATLYVNGFPAKRVLRRDEKLLIDQVKAWLESPNPEWECP